MFLCMYIYIMYNTSPSVVIEKKIRECKGSGERVLEKVVSFLGGRSGGCFDFSPSNNAHFFCCCFSN